MKILINIFLVLAEVMLKIKWGEVWPWGFDPFDKIAVMDTGDIEYSLIDLIVNY